MPSVPPVNDLVDDLSDFQVHLFPLWMNALRLQENRLLAGSPEVAVDIRFAVFAANSLETCCRMVRRHEVPGVEELLAEYKSRQPNARALRNALEHFDAFLRGEGRDALGKNWFPLGSRVTGDGQVILVIPPLGSVEATDFDVTRLIHDTLWLAGEVAAAIERDWPRRFQRDLAAKRTNRSPQVGNQ